MGLNYNGCHPDRMHVLAPSFQLWSGIRLNSYGRQPSSLTHAQTHTCNAFAPSSHELGSASQSSGSHTSTLVHQIKLSQYIRLKQWQRLLLVDVSPSLLYWCDVGVDTRLTLIGTNNKKLIYKYKQGLTTADYSLVWRRNRRLIFV